MIWFGAIPRFEKVDSHNHVGHHIISLVMQGEVTVHLESRKLVCHAGDAFTIPPYAVHSVYQERDARLLSICIGTAFAAETDSETAEVIVRELLNDVAGQGIFGEAQKEKLLPFARAVFRGRDKGGKEMDTGIKNLADRITSHPEYEWPMESLAADIFVSKYYLIKKFKRIVGMTPHLFRMRPEQSPSCRRVCRMKSLQVQRGYICLPSLCWHYVELNKRIIARQPLWQTAICGGLPIGKRGNQS